MANQKQLPNCVGISLKPQHYEEIINNQPSISWLEVHPENYMGKGGLPHYYLAEIHNRYPISMHGVGLSLGSSGGIDEQHLSALHATVKRHKPEQVSEHLAWSRWQQTFFNDLLPLPYTNEFLNIVCNNIHQVQDKLQQTILLENPSVYIELEQTDYNEIDFLHEVATKTHCGLLLDVNNVYVSANNLGFSAENYICQFPLSKVGEIHLAGHSQNTIDDRTILIDDHGSPVNDAVWDLYALVLKQLKHPVPTLIEWDTHIPSLETLVNQAHQAQALLDNLFIKGAS